MSVSLDELKDLEAGLSCGIWITEEICNLQHKDIDLFIFEGSGVEEERYVVDALVCLLLS